VIGREASENAAMVQLKQRGYIDKYRHLHQPVHLIAVEFGKNTRNVERFEVETMQPRPV
jgi:hypothetical protein